MAFCGEKWTGKVDMKVKLFVLKGKCRPWVFVTGSLFFPSHTWTNTHTLTHTPACGVQNLSTVLSGSPINHEGCKVHPCHT